jgi:hypothetical protein
MREAAVQARQELGAQRSLVVLASLHRTADALGLSRELVDNDSGAVLAQAGSKHIPAAWKLAKATPRPSPANSPRNTARPALVSETYAENFEAVARTANAAGANLRRNKVSDAATAAKIGSYNYYAQRGNFWIEVSQRPELKGAIAIDFSELDIAGMPVRARNNSAILDAMISAVGRRTGLDTLSDLDDKHKGRLVLHTANQSPETLGNAIARALKAAEPLMR